MADTKWDGHIRAIIRVNRDVLTRSATTGLWRDSSETALFVSDVMLPAAQCAKAIQEAATPRMVDRGYPRDEGISGTKGRDKRPGLDALLKGVARRESDIVAAWSVCRLGRSLPDLISFLGELQARDVDLFLISSSTSRRSIPRHQAVAPYSACWACSANSSGR